MTPALLTLRLAIHALRYAPGTERRRLDEIEARMRATKAQMEEN